MGLAPTRTQGRASSSPICLSLPVIHSSNSWRQWPHPRLCSQNRLPDPASLCNDYTCQLDPTTVGERDVTTHSFSSLHHSSSRSPCRRAGRCSASHKQFWRGQQHYSTDGVNESTLCGYLSPGLSGPSPKSPRFPPFRRHPICRAQLLP